MRSWVSGCVLGLAIGFVAGIVFVMGATGMHYGEVATFMVIAAVISYFAASLPARIKGMRTSRGFRRFLEEG